jgi:hypothetical protein
MCTMNASRDPAVQAAEYETSTPVAAVVNRRCRRFASGEPSAIGASP